MSYWLRETLFETLDSGSTLFGTGFWQIGCFCYRTTFWSHDTEVKNRPTAKNVLCATEKCLIWHQKMSFVPWFWIKNHDESKPWLKSKHSEQDRRWTVSDVPLPCHYALIIIVVFCSPDMVLSSEERRSRRSRSFRWDLNNRTKDCLLSIKLMHIDSLRKLMYKLCKILSKWRWASF